MLVAGLVLGTPVRAPRLREEIPSDCEAKREYLLAYAYARELPEVSRKFLAAAESELGRCTGDTRVLRERILSLQLPTRPLPPAPP